jgi:hypothetical protein
MVEVLRREAPAMSTLLFKLDLLEDKFPAQSPYTGQVVFSDEVALDRPETRAAVDTALAAVAPLSHVVAVSDPVSPVRTAGAR